MRTTLVFALLSFILAAGVAAAAEPSVLPKDMHKLSRNDKIDGKTLPEWIKEIKDTDPAVAELAMQAVQLYGPDVAAKEAGPALVDALSFTDAALKVNACIALANLGVDESIKPRALSVLRLRLNDQQSIVRLHAVVVAGRMGADARLLMSDLIPRVTDPGSYEIRRAAAYAVGQAGQATEMQEIDMNAARALYGTFSGPNPDHSADVRLIAVWAFGSMGIPRDDPSRQAIIRALAYAAKTDKNKAVVIWAHIGLMAHKEPIKEHLAAIVEFLKDKDFNVHYQALRAIGAMKEKARASIPDLVKGLQDKEPVLQAMAAWALGEMGKDASDAIIPIEKLRDEKDTGEGVKATCKEALEKITGKAADKAAPAVDKAPPK
jgi:hypothetical protein